MGPRDTETNEDINSEIHIQTLETEEVSVFSMATRGHPEENITRLKQKSSKLAPCDTHLLFVS